HEISSVPQCPPPYEMSFVSQCPPPYEMSFVSQCHQSPMPSTPKCPLPRNILNFRHCYGNTCLLPPRRNQAHCYCAPPQGGNPRGDRRNYVRLTVGRCPGGRSH